MSHSYWHRGLYLKLLPVYIEDFGSDHQYVEHIRKALTALELITGYKKEIFQMEEEQSIMEKEYAKWSKDIDKYDPQSGPINTITICTYHYNNFQIL